MVDKVKGGLRLAAVDPAADRLGLAAGLTLADAQARVPEIETVLHRPDQDDALLNRLCEDFDRFSPMVALDPPHGLVLDVTGCSHLFGGEDGLLAVVRARCARMDLNVRLALGTTPQAARALARFAPQGRALAPGEQSEILRRLPLAALELDPKEEQALSRAGLKTLDAVDTRSGAALAARFGADFPARLARVLGREDIRITPARPPAPCVVDRIFFEPISRDEDIERVLADLLTEACGWLEIRSKGGRAFRVGFYRLDGMRRCITVRTGEASRDPGVLLRLFRERLAALANPLDPGFGFDQVRLEVTVLQTLEASQTGLAPEPRPHEDLGRLVDRLTARLGPDAVTRFNPHDSHWPERAARTLPFARSGEETWPEISPDDPPLRPLQMFDPPQPIETLAEIPDGYPLRFRWRRVQHDVARAEGPERIAPEWWRSTDRTRDYYRVEDREGRRFWLFRSGLYGDDETPRWFIHGLFA